MRIGLLECDVIAEKLRPIAGGFPEMFGGLLAGPLPDAELISYDLYGGHVPASPKDCDAWVCTGSRASAYDDEEWIANLSGFVREIHDQGSPFVGICFGHQVLARALGGTVEKAPGGWGAGVHQLDVVVEPRWMDPALVRPNLLFMHQDQVTSLPDGATLLARTDHCPIAMFELGSMVGLQAHPEFTPGFVAALLDDRIERIGAAGVEAAHRSLATPTDEAVVGQWLSGVLSGIR
ncbi:MAG: hypothetical protein QOG03_708 [Actinomycetota bacterium]|jgi:GMP synthase-like glutamine amidotransferase|nr:hypothetical protein [Actinomycetota bacterium]